MLQSSDTHLYTHAHTCTHHIAHAVAEMGEQIRKLRLQVGSKQQCGAVVVAVVVVVLCVEDAFPDFQHRNTVKCCALARMTVCVVRFGSTTAR